MPNPASVEVMSEIDCLGQGWRSLVHEFGLVMVRSIRDDWGDDVEMARFQLNAWRARRQQEWLATNYISTRSAHPFLRRAA